MIKGVMEATESSTLKEKTLKELHDIARDMAIPSFMKLRKQELIGKIQEEKGKSSQLAPVPAFIEQPVTEPVKREPRPEPPPRPELPLRPERERDRGDRPPRMDQPPRMDHDRGDRNRGDRPRGDRNRGDRPRGDRPRMDQPLRSDQDRPRIEQGEEREDRAPQTRAGILEVLPEGYGFIRVNGYLPSPGDIYISQTQIKRFRLKTGHVVCGQVRPAKDGEKYFSLIKIDTINEREPERILNLRSFDDLTPIYPQEMIGLEIKTGDLSTRIMDIFCPIGKGQRGLIVSPPKAGKTTLLKSLAKSIEENYPEIILIALLIDERPEEVTDFERSIKGEVVASTFDKLPEHHTRITEMVLEKAKRNVEMGKDVIILVDSITRMSRAYNLIIPPSGRTLSGGLDPNAMHSPKRFFGAARNMEFGGSLTILATALVETGSRMDDVIFEEFKGTGNMELKLDRKLSDRRMFPAIDIKMSGTRKEELLLEPEVLRKEHLLRRMLANADTVEATEFIMERLRKSKSNPEFLQLIVDSGVEF